MSYHRFYVTVFFIFFHLSSPSSSAHLFFTSSSLLHLLSLLFSLFIIFTIYTLLKIFKIFKKKKKKKKKNSSLLFSSSSSSSHVRLGLSQSALELQMDAQSSNYNVALTRSRRIIQSIKTKKNRRYSSSLLFFISSSSPLHLFLISSSSPAAWLSNDVKIGG